MSHIPPAARLRLAWLLSLAVMILPAIILANPLVSGAGDPVAGFFDRALPMLFSSLLSGIALIYTNSIVLKEQMSVMRAEQERTRTQTNENTRSLAQMRTHNGAIGREVGDIKKNVHEITGRVTEAEREIVRLDESDYGLDHRVERIERTLNGRLRETPE